MKNTINSSLALEQNHALSQIAEYSEKFALTGQQVADYFSKGIEDALQKGTLNDLQRATLTHQHNDQAHPRT